MSDEEKKEELGGLEELEGKCQEYLLGWKRALADYDNLKKDLGRERENSRISVREDVAEQLVSVLDNFWQINKNWPELDLSDEDKKKFENFRQGFKLVYGQAEGVMKALGAEFIGEFAKFDPVIHESVGSVHRDDLEDGYIEDIIIPGWKMGNKIIRPARVIVNIRQK